MKAADLPATDNFTGRVSYKFKGRWVTVEPYAIQHIYGRTYLHIKNAAHQLKDEWEVEVTR